MSRRILPSDFRHRISKASPAAILGAFIAVLAISAATFGLAATDANAVEPINAADYSAPFNLDDLRPPQCVTNNVSVTNLVSGGVTPSGTVAGDLILADSFTTSLSGGDGDDCIVGTVGANIDGGPGSNDVCIGDVAKMTNCEHPYPA